MSQELRTSDRRRIAGKIRFGCSWGHIEILRFLFRQFQFQQSTVHNLVLGGNLNRSLTRQHHDQNSSHSQDIKVLKFPKSMWSFWRLCKIQRKKLWPVLRRESYVKSRICCNRTSPTYRELGGCARINFEDSRGSRSELIFPFSFLELLERKQKSVQRRKKQKVKEILALKIAGDSAINFLWRSLSTAVSLTWGFSCKLSTDFERSFLNKYFTWLSIKLSILL